MLRLYSHKLFDFMKRGSGILFAILATLFITSAHSQDQQDSSENVPKDWYLKDPIDDRLQAELTAAPEGAAPDSIVLPESVEPGHGQELDRLARKAVRVR